MVSRTEATRTVRKWLLSQPDLPGETELKQGQTPSGDKFVFLVDKFHKEKTTKYRLLVLGVFIASGNVVILNDRRDYVRSLVGEDTWTEWMKIPRINPKAILAAMEERLLAATQEPYEAKPKWFLRLTLAEPHARNGGTSAIAKVLVGGKSIRIPVHVNHSARARMEYIETHESQVQGGMAVVIVEDNASPEKIRSRLFTELGQKRKMKK